MDLPKMIEFAKFIMQGKPQLQSTFGAHTCRPTVHVVMYMTSVLDTRGGGLLGGEQNGNLKGAKIDT